MNGHQSNRRLQRRGYVLVMVLALLVISTTLLVAVSRAASRSMVAARAAQEDLQQRWGAASCRKAVLPYAEQILSALEQERHQPTPTFSISVQLHDQKVELIISDEQAKANVNALLQSADVSRSETRLRQGLSGTGLLNHIKLRPTIGPIVEPANPPQAATQPATAPSNQVQTLPSQMPTVSALGQVFDAVTPAQLLRPLPGSRTAALDLVTCWGNGAVNVRRASDAALSLAAGPSVSGVQIGRLIDARNAIYNKRSNEASFTENPADALKDLMIKTAGASLANKGNLGLIEGSRCHSLWIITHAPHRVAYDLLIRDETNETKPVVWVFSW